MADTARKTWTPEQKAEVVAFYKEHGLTAAKEKFNIKADSMIRRWAIQAAGGKVKRSPAQMRPHTKGAPRKGGRKLKWTPAKVAKVLEYYKTHTNAQTCEHFGVSSGQLHMWKNNLPSDHYSKGRPKRHHKANGAGNGHDVLNMEEKDALMWIERFRAAYMDALKTETPLAVDVLRGLRGGK